MQPRPPDPAWPCVDLSHGGRARFKLDARRPVPTDAVIRFDDRARRFVPRRLAVGLWPLAALDESQPYVPVRSRLLRAWLAPGVAYPFPRGTTVLRGRVMRDGAPARWSRIRAIGPLGDIAGRGHADDRGEFVVVINDPGQNPVRNSIPIELRVAAQRNPEPPDPDDRCADLTADDVPRSS